MNREAWLTEAALRLIDTVLVPAGYALNQTTGLPLADGLRVSMSYPTHNAISRKARVLGECVSPLASTLGYTELLISPFLEDAIGDGSPNSDNPGVLETLLHELGHAALGTQAGHGPQFAKYCKDVGLIGNPTATRAGPALNAPFMAIVDELGPFPHARISLTELEKLRKKQQTRLLKAICTSDECPVHDDPYILRITAKQAQRGFPLCGVCGERMEVEGLSPSGLPEPEDEDEEADAPPGFGGDFDPNDPEALPPDPFAGDEPADDPSPFDDGDDAGEDEGDGGHADPEDMDEGDGSDDDAEPSDEGSHTHGSGADGGTHGRAPDLTPPTQHPNDCDCPSCAAARRYAGVS